MTEAGEIHSRAWIPPSIHNAGEFDFPLLILITYLADYFFFIVDYIFLSFFFISFLFFFFFFVPWEAFLRRNDRWWRRNKRRGKFQPGNRDNRECPRVDGNWSIPFDDLTGIPSRLFRGCTFGVLGRDVKIFRSVDSETWTLGLIDRSDWFFTNKCSNETRLELFWINEAGCARMRLTPKLPRATDTVHASYRITKRTRTWIFTWPDRDSLPPSVTS